MLEIPPSSPTKNIIKLLLKAYKPIGALARKIDIHINNSF